MSPSYINPVQWQQSVGYARQACARIFRDGGNPADAVRAFGLAQAEFGNRLEHRRRPHRPVAVRLGLAQGCVSPLRPAWSSRGQASHHGRPNGRRASARSR